MVPAIAAFTAPVASWQNAACSSAVTCVAAATRPRVALIAPLLGSTASWRCANELRSSAVAAKSSMIRSHTAGVPVERRQCTHSASGSRLRFQLDRVVAAAVMRHPSLFECKLNDLVKHLPRGPENERANSIDRQLACGRSDGVARRY